MTRSFLSIGVRDCRETIWEDMSFVGFHQRFEVWPVMIFFGISESLFRVSDFDLPF
jgi:hypothetical protein